MSKFKYLLSAENVYLIEYERFTAEITGAEIMKILYEYKYEDYDQRVDGD